MLILSTLQLILIAAAVIPAVALMVYVYRADRLEKEPTVLLWSLIFQGIISTALAVFTERLGAQMLGSMVNPRSMLYQFLFYFLVVGLSEEGFKYLLLKRRTWASPYFNCRFDGVVYAVFVSLGFALCENVFYAITYDITAIFGRTLTAIPGHACFGIYMGVFYGIAKKYDKEGNYARAKHFGRLASAVPILLHGAYDYIAAVGTTAAAWIFLIYIAVLFIVTFIRIKRVSDEDNFF